MSITPKPNVQRLLDVYEGPVRQALLESACPELASSVAKVTKRPASLRLYGAEEAAAIVAELDDPDVLSSVSAREKRVGVRDAMMKNKFTPASARVPLPARPRAAPIFQHLTSQPDVAAFAAQLSMTKEVVPWSALAAWALGLSTGAREHVEVLFRAAPYVAEITALLLAVEPHPDVIELPAALELTSVCYDYTRDRAVSMMLAQARPVTASMVRLAQVKDVEVGVDLDFSPEALLQLRHSARGGDRAVAVAVDPGMTNEVALDLLGSLSDADQHQAALWTLDPVRQNLLVENLTFFRPRTYHDARLESLLGSESSALSPKARLVVLRHASGGDVLGHLAGLCELPRLEGEVDRVCDLLLSDDPDRACTRDQLVQDMAYFESDAPDVAHLVGRVLVEARGAVDTFLHSSDSVLATQVQAVLLERLGSSRSRWQTVLSMGKDWEGTFPELLEMADIVAGDEPA